MAYVAAQEGTKLPIEILVIIMTYLPSAKYFFKCTCLSRTINSHLRSSATRQQWLLNLPPTPSVLFIANKMQISLPFEHARSAMEHGADKSHLKSILALSEHYLNTAIPPFLYNVYLSRQLLPDEISVLEDVYLQYFVFREATKRQEDSKTKWIEGTFGKTDINDHNVSAWVNHAFELSVSDFYTTIARRIVSKC
ncbi:hypothetical protein INT44_002044 [Umbelopsis vinacea]|uniref:F-box domain-containing protein n=1 Tax=Umbelopsis vinacea TaxID=44442 RepID=A0A8H7Q576_9FUNG|nr:hypothetical protein INT44_002044 [Umbelopsis vinacea]